jgi:transposase
MFPFCTEQDRLRIVRNQEVLWHDGLGTSLYAKRLERGRFIWPSPADGVVAISSAQLGYLLEGIDWRNPVRTWRPERAG